MILHGTTTLLTGATGGIGQAIARALHARGSSLVLTARRTDVLDDLAAEVGGRAVAVDLADRTALDELVAGSAAVDVVVANAALPASGALTSFTPQEIDRALEVNLRAPMMLAHGLLPGMIARGRGHIVFISSLAGKAATPGSGLYSATKFGLRGLGQGLRGDLYGTGVGASVIFPGFVRDAGMFHDSGVKVPSYVGTSTPQEVADAVVRAIAEDRGEIDVAPLGVRAGAALAGLAPELSARITRRMGSDVVAQRLAEGQRDKR